MAKQVKLSARARTQIGGTVGNKLKKDGLVPAVIYGGKDVPLALSIHAREIGAVLGRAIGENILVELEIEDGGATTNRMALIQEVQHETLTRAITHVDFHAVKMDEVLHASVPIEPTGEAEGVKSFGGIMEQSLRSLSISCLPRDLPEVIVVDISALKVGDSLHVKDIPLPEGVTAEDDEDLTVFLVAEPTVAEVVAPAAAARSRAAGSHQGEERGRRS